MKNIKFFALILCLPILFSACATFAPTTFGSYSEAEGAYAKGNYDKAIEKYHEYLVENPDGNMAIISQYYIARCYSEKGDTDRAKQGYEDVIRKYPKSDWAAFSKERVAAL